MFQPPNNSSLKAGLSVILAEGPSLGSQMPGSRPCEAWASHPPSSTGKWGSKPPHRVVQRTSGERLPKAPSPGLDTAAARLFSSIYQRAEGCGSLLPPGGRGPERPLSACEDADLGLLPSSALSRLCDLELSFSSKP